VRRRPHPASLPALALALVAAVLGIQLAAGGATYAPLRPADPCEARAVTSAAGGIDGLSERLVLLGLDDAACTLHLSREELALTLAQSGNPSDVEVEALRTGLLSAVTRMKDDGSLPPASALLDEALDSADLNRFLEAAIRALPDSVVDAALQTDDVLDRTIEGLDLRALLADVDDRSDLEQQVDQAVTQAVKDSLAARLRGLL
jgi:hypothetical protein